MIAKTIYEHAKLHVDGDFPWVHAQRWINEAQQMIASICETGGVLDSVTIYALEDSNWHDLPDNVITVKGVTIDGEEYRDYKTKPGSIYILEAGTYEVEYTRIPIQIALESDTPEVHELYHFPMSYWIGSREQYRFNPDSPDGNRLEQAFYREVAIVDKRLQKKPRVRYVKV